jgi:LysR family glycine cleavage system transcriptional activator
MAQDRSLLPMTALRAFQAAGTAGSFQDAARELSVTPSAISHQIRVLEHWLGKPLFTRVARQVQLTSEGRTLLRVVGHAFGRIRAAADRIRASDAGMTTIRISALPLFTSVWLIPRIERFERENADVAFEIDTSNRLVDLAHERVDLAIRNLRRAPVGLGCRKLIDVRPAPLCTAELRDRLCDPADLKDQTLIHVSARPDSWPQWLNEVGCPGLQAKRNLTFDSLPVALEAASRGRGIALGFDPIVWDAPAAAALVRAFPHQVAAGSSYYLVYRKADLARPKLRACVDWLVAEMGAYKHGLRRRAESR